MSSLSEEGIAVLGPPNLDVPQFEVIPRRKCDSQSVALYNSASVKIAEGLLCNIRSSAMAGSSGPLDELDVEVQVSHTFVLAELLTNGDICLYLGQCRECFLMALVSCITVSVILITCGCSSKIDRSEEATVGIQCPVGVHPLLLHVTLSF